MKKYILTFLVSLMSGMVSYAQTAEKIIKGTCGDNTTWTYDGYTLTISASTVNYEGAKIADYNLQNVAPWIKKKLDVKRVRIGEGIRRIGACAFANCVDLQECEFATLDIEEIGWGAFLNCHSLHHVSIPSEITKIETIAFANCTSLSAIHIPEHCRVEDQAFASCSGLTQVSIGATCLIGNDCFSLEVQEGGKYAHRQIDVEVKKLPVYITTANCKAYGLSTACVEKYYAKDHATESYDDVTSSVDINIPRSSVARNDTYALIIGNQNYRFVPDVPYAIHDAHVFAQYCMSTLGIPANNIHVTDNATKSMIKDQEMDWLSSINSTSDKNLIVYYAGHGVPDTKNKNKAYLLPSDVLGTQPQHGIAMDEFYGFLAGLGFNRVNVFLDACFSGITRDNEGVTEGTRAVEIVVDEATIDNGNVIVFSAAQGNETAQAYTEQGHGLFTFYLLQELQANRDVISLGQFTSNIIKNVKTQAPTLQARKNQTPSVNVSSKMRNWQNLIF